MSHCLKPDSLKTEPKYSEIMVASLLSVCACRMDKNQRLLKFVPQNFQFHFGLAEFVSPTSPQETNVCHPRVTCAALAQFDDLYHTKGNCTGTHTSMYSIQVTLHYTLCAEPFSCLMCGSLEKKSHRQKQLNTFSIVHLQYICHTCILLCFKDLQEGMESQLHTLELGATTTCTVQQKIYFGLGTMFKIVHNLLYFIPNILNVHVCEQSVTRTHSEPTNTTIPFVLQLSHHLISAIFY